MKNLSDETKVTIFSNVFVTLMFLVFMTLACIDRESLEPLTKTDNWLALAIGMALANLVFLADRRLSK